MTRSILISWLLALAAGVASAQTAAPAPAAAAAGNGNGKKELISRILKVQQPEYLESIAGILLG